MVKSIYSLVLVSAIGVAGVSVSIGQGEAEKQSAKAEESARRLEVLFLGSPNGSHRPMERFNTIRKAHGAKGINYTYAHQPTALTKVNLAKYDALMVYGNHDKISKAQESALLEYSSNGGACVFLHSACGCFRNSEKFIKLLGAQFKSHGRGVFRTKIVNPEHPVMKGFPGFECWDESYVHQKHNNDRIVLQKREEEPWTWVRTNGKGRVFYTASGHDHRCWDLPEYHDLVMRGLMWTVGDKKAKLVKDLKLPKFGYYTSKVNIVPRKSWGTPLDRKVPETKFQKPLPASESMKLAQVPVGMELQLFAEEPMIKNPIALNWDSKGRMWAVEAYDYPNSFVMNSPGLDTIKILEDTDNDGKADKESVFAKGLTICTSVLPLENGCITTDGTNMVFLRDTNGDGKADKKEVIFSGIQLYDTHACVSNIRLGLDGWIYATVGYSGVKTEVAGEKIGMKMGVFRFKRDGSAFEVIQSTTNNTWGLAFNEDGRLLGSTANNNPSFYVGVPNRHYTGTGLKPERTPRADNKDIVYPMTFDTLQVDCKNGFTAAAGHSLYTARLFSKEWWNRRAFICAPTSKLVSAPIISKVGSGFKMTNAEHNIYASADGWSAPVAAEVGPDGAVYIADWYNSIVQHNVYGDDQKRGKGNAYMSEHRDRQHGRIYRILPKGAKVEEAPSLKNLDDKVKALSNSNMFWRMLAQEAIVSEGKKAIPALRQLASKDVVGSIHAVYVLAQLGDDVSAIETKSVKAAVVTNSAKTEEVALKHLQGFVGYDAETQLAVLLHVCDVKKSKKVLDALFATKAGLAESWSKDALLVRALNVAVARHGESGDVSKINQKRLPLSASAKRGEAVYKTSCIACHQPSGEGSPGVFPPLDGSEWFTRHPEHAVMAVLKGLSGPITVKGKKYNGVMPGQPQLSDQQVEDVLNYVRNGFETQVGDIPKGLVKKVKDKYKDRVLGFTEKEILAVKMVPTAQFDFTKPLGANAEKLVASEPKRFPISEKGISFVSNVGESSTAIKKDGYVDLPNGIISHAAKAGVTGRVSIESTFSIEQNRNWARVWSFGISKGGEDKATGGLEYITLIPQNAANGKLRLAARAAGQETFVDWERAPKKGEVLKVKATFSNGKMHLYVNDVLVGSTSQPKKLDLTKIKDVNNWVGRSQFPDPMFDGFVKDLKVFSQ